MKQLVLLLAAFCTIGWIEAQLISPCPRLFSYEPQKENDRWFGVVTLISESDLQGVWLRLVFDRQSLQLGNWFGEIKTTDNKEYLIKNRNHKLLANMPYALRFYLKFDPRDPPPQLVAIRLNAKTVCPEGDATTPPAITGGGLLITSGPVVTAVPDALPQPVSPINAVVPRPPSSGQTFTRPGGGWSPPESSKDDDDDDVFQGDFQLINRPQLQPAVTEPECGVVVTRGRRKRQTGYYSGHWESQGHHHHHGEERPDSFYYYNDYGTPETQIGTSGVSFYEFLKSVLARFNYGEGKGGGRTRAATYNARSDDEIAPLEAQPRPLITYGQSTSEGEFPWHAALYHERGADLQYICGASLIAKNYVVTVAHCVTRRKSQTTLNPDSLVVYLGKYYLKKWSNPGIQDSQVDSIVAHPDYNSQSYANDIALIKLVHPVKFTDYVRPVCLWEEGMDLNNVLNKPGTVVGWGFDHTGKVTEELTQAKMPVVTKETCIYSFPDFFSRFTTSKTYCAGFRNGTSVCNGDSGGGMVFPKSTSTPGRQVWQLRGLVSISVALQNQFRCDASHYVVFTDLAKYLDWIKDAMSK